MAGDQIRSSRSCDSQAFQVHLLPEALSEQLGFGDAHQHTVSSALNRQIEASDFLTPKQHRGDTLRVSFLQTGVCG